MVTKPQHCTERGLAKCGWIRTPPRSTYPGGPVAQLRSPLEPGGARLAEAMAVSSDTLQSTRVLVRPLAYTLQGEEGQACQ